MRWVWGSVGFRGRRGFPDGRNKVSASGPTSFQAGLIGQATGVDELACALVQFFLSLFLSLSSCPWPTVMCACKCVCVRLSVLSGV